MSKFIIPDAALLQHVIALGKTRSGKSSKIRLVVERLLDQGKPVTIIDPKGDWWGLKSSADGKKPGYPIVIFGSEHARHADVRITAHSGAGVAELVATGNRSALIDLRGMRTSERARFFIDFASSYFKLAKGERVLAIDEVHNFAPQGKIPDPMTGEMLHWANRLISEGAGMGITMLDASQRPQKVHKDFVTSHETLIATRVIHKLDRDAIKDWIDACGDPALGKEVMNSLAGMQRTEAWVYSPEVAFGPVRLTFPMFKTFDSFKPQSDKKSVRLKGWAAIDLKEVETRLAKVVEEAKANDPKELRKRIADLEAKVRKAETAKPAAPAAPAKPSKEDTAEKLQRARIGGKVEGYGEALKDIAPAFRDMKALIGKLKPMLEQFEAISPILDGWEKRWKEKQGEFAKQTSVPLAVGSSAPPPMRAAVAASRPRQPSPGIPAGGDGAIAGNEQRLLNSLATWERLGIQTPTNAQVAWLARYSPTSTSYTNPRGALKSKGLVRYPGGDCVELTDEGAACATPIDIGGSLLEFVLAQLPGNERRVLESVAKAYPEAIDNEAAAEGANYSASSTSYTNPRGAIKTKDLITYQSGFLRAADWLFAA